MKEFKIQGLVVRFGVYAIATADMDRIISAVAAQGIDHCNDPVEVIIRIPEPRQDWVNKWYDRAMKAAENWDILIKHCKQSTFICAYACTGDNEMASAAPRHGDKYDYKTGIAVAYAKLKGEPIPDYI